MEINLPAAVFQVQDRTVFVEAEVLPLPHFHLPRHRFQVVRINPGHRKAGDPLPVEGVGASRFNPVVHMQESIAAQRLQGFVDYALAALRGRLRRPRGRQRTACQHHKCTRFPDRARFHGRFSKS